MSSRLLPILLLAVAGLAPGCRRTTSVPPATVAPAVATRPDDLATMQEGGIYAGELPRPTPAPSPTPWLRYPGAGELPETPPTTGPARQGWNEVVRYLARHAGETARDSALLAPGSTLATPRWVTCGDKPRAALVDLDAVAATTRVPATIAAALGAIETLGLTIVYTSARTGAPLAGATAAMAKAGLRTPVPGQTLLPLLPGHEPATRAVAGARYCVLALVGYREADFPTGALAYRGGSAWPAGWFLVQPVAAIAE